MLGSLSQSCEVSARGRKGSPPCHELDTPIPFLTFTFAHKQQSGLARACQMSAAAWLTVERLNVDDTQSAFAVNFFANALRGEIFGTSVAHGNGTVIEDNFVHTTFGFFKLAWRDGRRGKVDGGNLAAEMERYSLKFEQLDERGGEHVLSRVLLHVIEAAWPVDNSANRARRDGLVSEMHDFVIFGVEHFHNIRVT